MIRTEIILNSKLIKKIFNSPDKPFFEVSTDTRTMQTGDAFVALAGESFDAFNFIDEVVNKGCAVFVYNHNESRTSKIELLARQHNNITFIGVTDTLSFLQEIATFHVQNLKKNQLRHVIGITGSNGKTTTKNILFHLLNAILGEKLTCTKGNLNNHIGVPLTLLKINENHITSIVEMGSNHPGEIDFLCSLAMPTAGIITNIGKAHLEFLHSQEGVLKEKRCLFDSVMKNTNKKGFFIINNDDEYLRTLPVNKNVVTIGKTKENIFFLKNGVEIIFNHEKIRLQNHELTGIHNFYNLAVAFMMAWMLFPDEKSKLINAVSSFKPSSNRSVWIKEEDKLIFMDAYNANPSSMQAAIEGFIDKCTKEKVLSENICFVLGDMNELGATGPALHEEIGGLIKKMHGKNAIFVGRFAKSYQKGFGESSQIYQDVNELLKDWKKIKKKYEYFFIKGSRSLQLELLMDIT